MPFSAGAATSSTSLLSSGTKPTGLPGTSTVPTVQASQISTVQDLIQVELHSDFQN